MNSIDAIGFIGVSMILLAYILNILGRVNSGDLPFILLNLIGAALACLASALLAYWPFIILEGTWTAVSLYALVRRRN